MNVKRWIIGGGAVIGLLVAVTVVRSDDKQPQHEMTPEQQKEMEAWQKAGAVGPEHERFAKMAGKWKAEVKFWHAPGEPETSYGTADFKTILGGRYLEETFHGEAMGQPFEGRGITGYDNIKKKYVSLWLDTMSTSVMTSEGKWDSAAKGIASTGECTDPNGVTSKTRSQCREESDGKHVFEMYKTGADGKEMKVMEVTYTRS
jgi:hypothetical protein